MSKASMSKSPSPARNPAAKQRTPHFFDNPDTDRLLEMILNLAAEVSVMRDRLDTHERLAAKGAYSPADVESYEPSDDVRAAREAWRTKFMDRLMQAMAREFDETPH